MSIFDRISCEYKDKALVQHKAALRLIEFLQISDAESILDVACGPGHLTDFFRGLTRGKVVGTDISPGMIEKACGLYPGLEFRCIAAEDLDYNEQFDVAFCNSALMWFSRPPQAIQAIRAALRPGGRLGLANPATSEWSPWFSRIIAAVTARADIRPTFANWKDPWFFLPTEKDYQDFFEKCGFKTDYISVEREMSEYSVEEAFNIYLSGAANGFASKMFYTIPVTEAYLARFNGYVREEIVQSSRNGRTIVEFNRLYYIGKRA